MGQTSGDQLWGSVMVTFYGVFGHRIESAITESAGVWLVLASSGDRLWVLVMVTVYGSFPALPCSSESA